MADIEPPRRTDDTAERLERRQFAIQAHDIEGNPLDADDIAMFDSFDRQGLTDEQRLAYLTRRAQKLAAG